VERAARPVTVHELLVTAVRPAGEWLDVDVSVRCSSGTYIRALARDLGEALGVGGHLTALRRTAVGPFTVEDATPLEQLADGVPMLPLEEVARRSFPCLELDADSARAVSFGRALDLRLPDPEQPVAVLGPDGGFLALYRQDGERATPVAVFTG